MQLVLDEDIRWTEATGLEAYLEADRNKPMSIGQPLMRYALVKDDTGAYKSFVWTMHHAAYDSWSLSLILDTVHRAYRGDMIRRGPTFKAFVKYIEAQDNEATAGYWRNALADCSSVPFPAILPSMQGPVADGRMEYRFPRPSERSLDITASTLIRATWALVAGNMTNSDDVVFGVTVSGRNSPVSRIDQMAGPTIATVPVRIKLAKDQKLAEYLEAVQRQTIEMIPFEQTGLYRIAKISSDCQHACQFQTLLVVQSQDDSSSELLGRWQSEDRGQLLNTYPLMLELHLGETTVTATASFDSRAVEPWTVYRLLEQFGFVIQQLGGANLEQPLSSIEMVTHRDLEKIWEWNSAVPMPLEQSVHKMIEEKVRAQPDAPAIHAWDGEITYGELDALSSRLAGQLIYLGVAPGMLVPLCFEKSVWTMVAILGVLKAGGGFVLLDPSLPEHRLQNIVQQVKASFIISSISNQVLSTQLVPKVVALSSAFFKDLGNGHHNPDCLPEVSPSSTMYVVFTSGSTGVPKGVTITHRNLASALYHQVRLFEFTAAPRIFDFASYSFDASIFNAFITLAAGGCLCVPSDQGRKDNLVESITMLNPDVVILTPSVAQFLSPDDIPGVRAVMFCGEAVRIMDARPWWDKVVVWNGYGPSECTPMSTFNRHSYSLEETVRIGKGAGMVTWVVDPANPDNLLPPGCIGELLLEGPLASPGYLDDPQKTAAVFIENPAWLVRGIPGKPGRHGRLYKTGDLVHYNEDGSLTFIGRRDAQVKVRGQRVELGEVEHWVQASIPEAKQVVADVVQILPTSWCQRAYRAYIRIDPSNQLVLEGRYRQLCRRQPELRTYEGAKNVQKRVFAIQQNY